MTDVKVYSQLPAPEPKDGPLLPFEADLLRALLAQYIRANPRVQRQFRKELDLVFRYSAS